MAETNKGNKSYAKNKTDGIVLKNSIEDKVKKKRSRKRVNLMNFIFSIVILGAAIGKSFKLSPIEWIAIILWAAGILLYNFSTSKEKENL